MQRINFNHTKSTEMKKMISYMRMLIVAAISFALVKCGAKATGKEKQTDEAIIVKTQPVQTVSWSPTLNYSGLLASSAEAKLSFKIGGIIAKIYVKEGDHVSKGQLLATLDLTEINAQVQQSEQNADKAKRDAGRIKNLYRDTVATLEQLQNSNTQVSLAEQGLRIASFNRKYAQIYATDNGTILKKFMNEGELASPGTAVFYLASTQSTDWVIRFGVSDKDWAVLKKGDRAKVHIDAYPEEAFTGMISKIADGADAANGTYEVEIRVLPGTHKFAPGLFGTIELTPGATQTVAMIPIEALTEGDGKKGFIYHVNADQKTVSKTPVVIAFLEKDRIAIRSGLEHISAVVTDGSGYLTPNAQVKVVQ
jgi:multidrug efflux system membrane fusion protein